MTKEELRKQLECEGINQNMYFLEGGLPSECYCLSSEEGKWQVYYSERGNKSFLREFDSESEACDYFHEWINKDHVVQKYKR